MANDVLSAEKELAKHVLNAVKRLEREGDKSSVHNQKLVAAANLLANAIVNALPDYVVELPGGYRVWRHGTGPACLATGINRVGNADHFFDSHIIVPKDVKFARLFAEDVANGLLYGIRDKLAFQLKNNEAAGKFSRVFRLTHAFGI